MRKLLLVVGALIAAAVAVPGLAQAADVTITRIAFVPKTVTIKAGETVTWTNTDTIDHQIVSAKTGLASPVLRTGQSFTFTFSNKGKFTIKDALSKLNATVDVNAGAVTAPNVGAALSVTVQTSALRTVFNGSVTLSGAIAPRAGGEKVEIHAQAYGKNRFRKVGEVTTAADGTWSFRASPTIRTAYQSQWQNKTSTPVTVGVSPRVSIRVLAGGRISTSVVADRSFQGKLVKLQRRSAFGQWVTIKRAQLNASSAAVVRVALPKGTSQLRVAFSVNQAGEGYLGGFSRVVVVHR